MKSSFMRHHRLKYFLDEIAARLWSVRAVRDHARHAFGAAVADAWVLLGCGCRRGCDEGRENGDDGGDLHVAFGCDLSRYSMLVVVVAFDTALSIIRITVILNMFCLSGLT